ncbi:MAG: DNA polymerase III subunit alpha [Christensenellaceae bacterium]|jgi:DNA polymerase-3 subunit alpha|nr:DNA polymerase III subunit alpha [Christensenellaceae bacterium]
MPGDKVFVHLHNHTQFSLLDGAANIKDLVNKAVESGANAVAMTDHGNVYGAIKFYNECKSRNVKPIIGCEFYVAEDMYDHSGGNTSDDDGKNKRHHLILIAKNYEGFKNLSRLSSLSFIDGFYYKPRIDLKLLSKYSSNLICLTACIAGAVPQLLLANRYVEAKAYAMRLKDMFAEGDFYIEMQDHGLLVEKELNSLLFRMSRDLNVKCVATNDIHYINQSDHEMHHVLLCIRTNKKIDESDGLRFPSDGFYYKSYDEMYSVLGQYNDGEALKTTLEIADKCNVEFKFKEYKIPEYQCPGNMPPADFLRELTYKGLVKRYGTITDEIRERAESELEVIIGMGFSEYYLIVWDFIFYAKNNDIPVGAGRGSGVGSLIAYAIEITNVDPLKYGLIFERFLNWNRTTMPDFDVDFCYNRRSEVIDYVKNKYGSDRISQIITFGKLMSKAALKDVARVYRIPYNDVTEMTKALNTIKRQTDSTGKTIPITIGSVIDKNSPYAIPAIIDRCNSDDLYKKVFEIAKQIEGLPRNTSIHAAGVVIYKEPALDMMPLAKNGEDLTTQFDMSEVENLGLLKMDFLALITLTDVKMCHDYVLKTTGKDIDFNKLGYDDPAVYSFISTGETDAVFQLESGGMKRFMTQLKPKNLEDIIVGISLYRPGPMDAIPGFLKNRENPKSINYKHELLKPILELTYGTIVYQEQAMMITRVLAGYDMTRADHLRTIISKKKTQLIPEERNVFIYGKHSDGVDIPGCVGNNVPKEVGAKVFDEMESFASYAFNKSHAAAYAVLSYETAYFRYYYPTEFMTAVLNNRIGKPDDTKKYMNVIRAMNIRILQPDINKSGTFFLPSGKDIRYGLACIKNIGVKVMDQIVNEREKSGPYKDFVDFISRILFTNINTKGLESLIKGGALDCFGQTRRSLIMNLDAATKCAKELIKQVASNQFNLFESINIKPSHFDFKSQPEYLNREKFLLEKEVLGMYISGHPLEGHAKEFESFSFNTSMLSSSNYEDDDNGNDDNHDDAENISVPVESLVSDGQNVLCGGLISNVALKRTGGGQEFAVFVLEDLHDKIEVVAFSSTFEAKKHLLVNDTLVRIRGRLNYKDDSWRITALDISPWHISDNSEDTLNDSIILINKNNLDPDSMSKINTLINNNPGNVVVRFQYRDRIEDVIKRISAPTDVVKEISEIIGRDKVKILTAKMGVSMIPDSERFNWTENLIKQILYINCTDKVKNNLEDIINILKKSPGETTVRLQINGKIKEFKEKISNPEDVCEELLSLVGIGNAKLVPLR